MHLSLDFNPEKAFEEGVEEVGGNGVREEDADENSSSVAEPAAVQEPLRPSDLRVVCGLGAGSTSVVVGVDYAQNLASSSSSGSGAAAAAGGGGGFGPALTAATAPMALKCVLKKHLKSAKERKRFTKELDSLSSIPSSPFLQRFMGAFESRAGVFLCCERATGGDLFFHLDQETTKGFEGFAEATARALLAEIILGLTHMHKHGFIHRDIRMENVYLDAAGHVKLIGFALAHRIAKPGAHQDAIEEPLSPTGSLIYMAPELLEDRSGGRHTDWWALGVLAHEFFTGRSPWTTLTDKRKIRNEIVGSEVKKLPTDTHHSEEASSLVHMLLRRHAKSRLGYRSDHEVQSHSFFAARVDWDTVRSGRAPPALHLGHEEGPSGGGGQRERSKSVTDQQQASVVDPDDQQDAIELYQRHMAEEQKYAASSSTATSGDDNAVAAAAAAAAAAGLSAVGGGSGSGDWLGLGLPVVEGHPEVSEDLAAYLKELEAEEGDQGEDEDDEEEELQIEDVDEEEAKARRNGAGAGAGGARAMESGEN